MANVGLAGQNAVNVVGGPTVTGTASGTGASSTLARGSGSTLTDKVDSLVRATFDKVIVWKNRFEPSYRQYAYIEPRDVAHPGETVQMFRAGATGLTLATTPLSEYEDPDSKALPGNESTSLTTYEYGDHTLTSLRLHKRAWANITEIQIEHVRRHMRDTVDAIYMNALYASTGGFANTGFLSYKGDANGALSTTTAAAAGAQSLQAGHVRRIVAKFRSLGMPTFDDGLFLGLITPDVSVAFREGTAVTDWRYPHLEENANGNIWAGTVGVFEGCRFIESPQFKGIDKGANVNTSLALVDQTPATSTAANLLFLSSSGIAEATVIEPHTTTTAQPDKFGRLFGVGWYGWFGAGVYDNNGGILFDVKAS